MTSRKVELDRLNSPVVESSATQSVILDGAVCSGC